MPFYSPFNIPFFYNIYKIPRNSTNNYNKNTNTISSKENIEPKEKASVSSEASDAFFEIFGLKLYFDDILIMCILFFLYNEKVHNEELFICLILLLLT